jgi:hypothetical protein
MASDAPRTPKEAIYDDLISPLMVQIIAICKEHKVNVAAQFSLGFDADQEEALFCTTVLPLDESDVVGHERIIELGRAMKPRSAPLVAFTIYGGAG